MENNQESNDQQVTEDSTQSNAKQWLQDNMRIIVSILIVVLIAGGIYSYSKRTEPITETPVATEGTPELAENENSPASEGQVQVPGQEENKAAENQEQPKPAAPSQPETSSVASSQETENSFIETAVRGDSRTTLARKALADYMEKNPDSSLTAEHKIYVEDYLRKYAPGNERIVVGTSVEFSKDLVKNAIEKSKTLSDKQLQNLHKYVVRVPSLS